MTMHGQLTKVMLTLLADDKLPLAGGDLTGVVNFSGDARIKGLDNCGNEKIEIYPEAVLLYTKAIRLRPYR